MAVLDVDAIAKTAKVGINRAWLFLGWGLNCAARAKAGDLEVQDAGYLRLLPDEGLDTTLAEAKDEFGIWIVSNGLREAIETFDVFLGAVYQAALFVEAWAAGTASRTDDASCGKRAAKFSQFGTEKRLTSLDNDFAIAAEYGSDIVSLRKARNCLTHRLGVVGHEDTGAGGQLTLRWHVFELYGQHPDGSEFVACLDSLPVKFPEGSPVVLRHGLREHRYFLGERLVLSPAELKEICFAFLFVIDQVRLSFVSYAERMGVRSGD
jgi:hypothetical protein